MQAANSPTSRYPFIRILDLISGLHFEARFISSEHCVLAFLQLFKFSPRCLFWLGVGSQEGDTTPVVSGQFIRDCRVCSSLTSTSRAATPLCWDLGIVINMKKSDLELYSMA